MWYRFDKSIFLTSRNVWTKQPHINLLRIQTELTLELLSRSFRLREPSTHERAYMYHVSQLTEADYRKTADFHELWCQLMQQNFIQHNSLKRTTVGPQTFMSSNLNYCNMTSFKRFSGNNRGYSWVTTRGKTSFCVCVCVLLCRAIISFLHFSHP